MTFKDDKLDREKYSDFLTEILSNPNKYKRLSDSESLTIAIDSSWGTGKTTFLKMWKNKLEATNEFSIISYNAWENDFANDPLESFIYTILSHNIFSDQDSSSIKKVAKTSFKIIKLVQNITNIKPLGNEDFEALEKRIDKVHNIQDLFKSSLEGDNLFRKYSEYKKLIEDLKESLHEMAQDKPIVIVIDELDRCKPLFSIKLLEFIKHIFDVPNVAFIFALDMEQLGHSIKCVYGSGMDANGYLCRFFDYISKMPKPNGKKYIQFLIDEKSLIRKIMYDSSTNKENVKFVDMFSNFALIFNLSLRDINTIYNNFLILESLELKHTACVEAYSLYLVLLILKYKYLNIFNSIFEKNGDNIKNEDVLLPFSRGKNKYFNYETLNFIMSRSKIEDLKYNIKSDSDNIDGVFNLNLRDDGELFAQMGELSGHYFIVNDTINISNCLFYDDLDRFNNIQDKTLAEYIQEKLEFFDFSLENREQNVTEDLVNNY